MNSLEQRIEKLEARSTKLEQQLTALQVHKEISDLMGRYAVYCNAGRGDLILRNLWSQDDQVSLEYGASGVYSSPWKIKTFYTSKVLPGKLETVSFSSPVITVAADGSTVHGSWTAFCTQTDAGDLGPTPVTPKSNRRALFSSRTSDGQEYRAEILFQRYEAEFCREAGAWKILHLHVMEYFRCPYNKDWVTFAQERFDTDGIWLESLFETPMPLPDEAHGENLPSLPTSFHWQYTVDSLVDQQAGLFESAHPRKEPDNT